MSVLKFVNVFLWVAQYFLLLNEILHIWQTSWDQALESLVQAQVKFMKSNFTIYLGGNQIQRILKF